MDLVANRRIDGAIEADVLFVRSGDQETTGPLEHISFAVTPSGTQRARLHLKSDQMALDGDNRGKSHVPSRELVADQAPAAITTAA